MRDLFDPPARTQTSAPEPPYADPAERLGPGPSAEPPASPVRLWWCRIGRGLSWWTTDEAEAREADEAIEYTATRVGEPF